LSGDILASIIGIAAALTLALRGLRARPAALGPRVTMAVAWLVIIVAIVFVIHSFRLRGQP
jgi:thiol:disulfide interchange protein